MKIDRFFLALFRFWPRLSFQIARWRASRRVRAYRARAPRGCDCYATAAPVSPVLKGIATLVWGTKPGGTDILPVITGGIATSISITPDNGGPVAKIENGDGSCVNRTYLDDGFTGEAEFVFDSSKTYPALYSAVTLTIPKAVDLSGGTAVATYPCMVESSPVKFERKKEAMITFRFAHNPGVDGAGS